MKGHPIHRIDATLCLRCEDNEPVLGSSFCEPCKQALASPAPAPQPERRKQLARPPQRITKCNPRG